MSDESQAAQTVREATDALNRAIRAAVELGLRVEIRDISVREMGQRWDTPMFNAEITKPV